MTDEDILLEQPSEEFGAGVVGVCDICKVRQAVIVLQEERFKLCVLDFLNKSWIKTEEHPKAHTAPFRSSTEYIPCRAAIGGTLPVVVLSPRKEIKRYSALVVPEVYGITTQVLDAAIHLVHEGYEVAVPDFVRIHGVNLVTAAKLRASKILLDEVHISQSHRDRSFRLLEATRKYLLSRDLVLPERQVVVGLSYGGALALGYAAQTPSLSGVAVAYPYMIHPESYLQYIHCPVFVVSGGGDPRTGPSVFHLHHAARQYGVNLGEMIVPSVGHHFMSRAHRRRYRPKEAELAWSRMMAFVNHCMAPPALKMPPKMPSPPPAPAATPAAPRPSPSSAAAAPATVLSPPAAPPAPPAPPAGPAPPP